MGDDLARLMFEAHELEQQRQDYAKTPRRWTSLSVQDQDAWEKAAGVARKHVNGQVFTALRENLRCAADDSDLRQRVGAFIHRWGY